MVAAAILARQNREDIFLAHALVETKTLKWQTDAEFSLAVIAIQKGSTYRAVIDAMLDHWLGPSVLEKQRGDRNHPGSHGIPTIGRLEAKTYDELTFTQKEAFDALRKLIDELYRQGGYSWAGVEPWSVDQPIDEWKNRALAALAAHPMQAFLLGQMLASEQMRAPMPRPLTAEDRRAIEFLQHYTFNEISTKFDELKGSLRHALVQGIEHGENPREVARRLSNTLDDYDTDWGLIAITETSRAESQGRLREYKDAGLEQVVGSSAHDNLTCPKCLQLIDGVVVAVADLIGRSNYGLKQDQWQSVIPLHPRSVAPGSKVLTELGMMPVESVRPGQYVFSGRRFCRVLALARREHSGPVFNVGGPWITGDHPVLTRKGWREAALLGESSDVLRVDRIAWAKICAEKAYNGPAVPREPSILAAVLGALTARTVPCAAVYLYRQKHIRQGEVDIEYIDGETRNDVQAVLVQLAAESALQDAHLAFALNAECAALQKYSRFLVTTLTRMGRRDLLPAFLRGHLRPFKTLGLRAAALLEAVTSERIDDAQSADAIASVRKTFDRFTSNVAAIQFSDSGFAQAVITHRHYDGPVYCLQVEGDETFVADGVVVHNCRCVWLPYREAEKLAKSNKAISSTYTPEHASGEWTFYKSIAHG